MAKITDNTAKKLRNLRPFKKGKEWNGNAKGRPKGSVSPITKVKQIFKNDPETFETFIKGYIKDPSNRKHIVEMIDGKPKGDSNQNNIMIVQPIFGGKSVSEHTSNKENIQSE